jgi:hypothetical protein
VKKTIGERSYLRTLRPAWFFAVFVMLCFAAALYAIGNVQSFTERTQIFLLKMILYTGVVLFTGIVIDFILNLGLAAAKYDKRFSGKSFVFLLIGIIAFIFSGAAAAILSLGKGTLPQ